MDSKPEKVYRSVIDSVMRYGDNRNIDPEKVYRPVIDPSIDIDLEGDVAIVTGATGGLGVPICIALAECGADIGAIARDEKGLKELSREIKDRGRDYVGIRANVSDLERIEAAFREIYDELGSIDILVNCAGEKTGKNMRNSTTKGLIKAVEREMKTNYIGTAICSLVAMEYMREKGYGRIINFGSIRAETSGTSSGYSPSKAAVGVLTVQFAVEIAEIEPEILVNCVSPSHIDAGMFGRKPKREKARYLKGIPMRRFGKPEEVANEVCWLASHRSSYRTGDNTIVDGAYSKRR